MTINLNPVFVYEIMKQKLNWDAKLSPVEKVSDFVETFNISGNRTLVLNGNGLLKNGKISSCGSESINANSPSDLIKNLGSGVKTIMVNLRDVCLSKQNMLSAKADIYGFEKGISDLVSDKSTLVSESVLQRANKKDTKTVSVSVGNDLKGEKKDILNLLKKLIESEYEKVDSKTKDGSLNQKIIGEIGLIISQGQKYVDVIDTTNLIQDSKICDTSDNNINNTMNVTNITKYNMLDDGESFCIDVDIHSFFTQSRIQTIDTTPETALSSCSGESCSGASSSYLSEVHVASGKEMLESGKAIVIESYVAGLLDQVYKMKDKYKVEIMRPSDTVIMVKITDNQTKEIYFNKIDITNAVSDTSCGMEKTDSRIREYISVDKYCKKSSSYKVQFLITGSEHTVISSRKIPFAKLQESLDVKQFSEYVKSLHNDTNAVAHSVGQASPQATSSIVSPKRAFLVVGRPWNYYGGVYGGLYGIGLGSAGIYSYPRVGFGGVYGYPYGYSGVFGSPFVYIPPLSLSMVPTAPVIASPFVGSAFSSPLITGPIVSSPFISSVSPFTYNYPMITTSNYSIGSYYSPYLGLSSTLVPYSISSIEKEGEHYQSLIASGFVEIDGDVLPKEASGFGELSNVLAEFELEKIGNTKIKVCSKKNFVKNIHYYEFENGRIYLLDQHEYELAM